MLFWLFFKKFDWNMSVNKKISSFSFWFFSFLVLRPSNGFVINSDEIQNFFWPQDFFWGIIKVTFNKIICNLFQGPTNPEFRSVKEQIDTFFKKDSWDLKNSFHLRFLWIPSKPGNQNWKVPFFGVHNCKKIVWTVKPTI